MSLYADDTILYTENPKDSTQKLLEMINEFSKVAGYKINIQKSFACLTNNEISERKSKKKNCFLKSHQTKQNKKLGINLTNEVKDLHIENYKTLIKKTEDDSKKWDDIPCSWIERINIVKTAILPKAIYRFNMILSNYP